MGIQASKSLLLRSEVLGRPALSNGVMRVLTVATAEIMLYRKPVGPNMYVPEEGMMAR